MEHSSIGSRPGTRVRAAGRGLSRRELLGALGFGAGSVVLLNGCVMPAPADDPPRPPAGVPDPVPFVDGVMAGDPRPDGTAIWTRLEVPPGTGDVGVMWSVAEDPGFTTMVAGGLVTAGAAGGHAVTVPVSDLAPDRWYWYRFETSAGAPVGPAISRAGRLRTAPAPGSSPDHLRFAFGSCQQINDSWFVAHRAAAAEPGLDFFVHLGDYVYVSDTDTLTLDDYRAVQRRWRAQPLLRDLQARVPTVAMWDDGEFYNGVDRTGPPARLAAAKQAWFEQFPVVDPGDQRLYRRFGWGDLADVSMIDVRSYRDPAIDDIVYTSGGGPYDPTRTTLGAAQMAWLRQGLRDSTARWRLIGNPYNINPWRLVNLEFLRAFRPDLPPEPGIYAPNEAWDDYVVERRDLLQFLADEGIDDTVFVSGHTHIYLVSDLRPEPDRPGSPVVAHDFCTGSLTADPDIRRAYLGDLPREVAEEILRAAERWVLGQNPGTIRHMNLLDQGYTVVDVTPEEMVVTVRLVDTFDPDAEAVDGARFRLTPGAERLEILPASGAKGSFA
jgi:alkaline phosphatase D